MIPLLLLDILMLLAGLAFVGFALVNNELTRRWLKVTGSLLGERSFRRLIDTFADSRVGRMMYGGVLSVFAFLIGVSFIFVSAVTLVYDFLRR